MHLQVSLFNKDSSGAINGHTKSVGPNLESGKKQGQVIN